MPSSLRSALGTLLSAQAGTALVVQLMVLAPLSIFAALALMLVLMKP